MDQPVDPQHFNIFQLILASPLHYCAIVTFAHFRVEAGVMPASMSEHHGYWWSTSAAELIMQPGPQPPEFPLHLQLSAYDSSTTTDTSNNSHPKLITNLNHIIQVASQQQWTNNHGHYETITNTDQQQSNVINIDLQPHKDGSNPMLINPRTMPSSQEIQGDAPAWSSLRMVKELVHNSMNVS